MTTTLAPLCATCALLQLPQYTCEAFPKGIPDAILNNEHDHRQPYEGDGGITYRPLRAGDPQVDPFERQRGVKPK